MIIGGVPDFYKFHKLEPPLNIFLEMPMHTHTHIQSTIDIHCTQGGKKIILSRGSVLKYFQQGICTKQGVVLQHIPPPPLSISPMSLVRSVFVLYVNYKYIQSSIDMYCILYLVSSTSLVRTVFGVLG